MRRSSSRYSGARICKRQQAANQKPGFGFRIRTHLWSGSASTLLSYHMIHCTCVLYRILQCSVMSVCARTRWIHCWAADKLSPPSSKHKKRRPYTIDFIAALRLHLDMAVPLDAAVYACLTTCFYASTRVDEFTVPKLDGFDPSRHVTRDNLSYDQDRNGFRVTVLHLPRSKTTIEGEDVYWAKQSGPTDPDSALNDHLLVNNPRSTDHLFAYRKSNGTGYQPLTKRKFIERLAKAVRAANLDPLQGHGIRIGSILEYLAWHAFWRHENQGAMGEWRLPGILAEACSHSRPLYSRRPLCPRKVHSLHNASCALEKTQRAHILHNSS